MTLTGSGGRKPVVVRPWSFSQKALFIGLYLTFQPPTPQLLLLPCFISFHDIYHPMTLYIYTRFFTLLVSLRQDMSQWRPCHLFYSLLFPLHTEPREWMNGWIMSEMHGSSRFSFEWKMLIVGWTWSHKTFFQIWTPRICDYYLIQKVNITSIVSYMIKKRVCTEVYPEWSG